MTVHRVKVCRCTHPIDIHDPESGRCLYGKDHLFGGCTCVRFKKRGRETDRIRPVPPLVVAVEDAMRALAGLRDALVVASGTFTISLPAVETSSTKPMLPISRSVSSTSALVSDVVPAAVRVPKPIGVKPKEMSTSTLTKRERLVLTYLAQNRCGLTKPQLAIMTGYKSGGSTLRNLLSNLRTAQLLDGSDRIAITVTGLGALGAFEPLPKGAQLVAYWKDFCGRCPATLLDLILAAHPSRVSRRELSTATRYEEAGSTLRNALSKLRTLELIEGRDDFGLVEAFARAAVQGAR